MRYNFHTLQEAIKKNAKFVLPEDINAPIHDYLLKRGFELTSKRLKEYEKHVRFGTIMPYMSNNINSRLKICVAHGMVGEIVEIHTVENGLEICTEEFTIKNANLDKKKPVQKEQK